MSSLLLLALKNVTNVNTSSYMITSMISKKFADSLAPHFYGGYYVIPGNPYSGTVSCANSGFVCYKLFGFANKISKTHIYAANIFFNRYMDNQEIYIFLEKYGRILYPLYIRIITFKHFTMFNSSCLKTLEIDDRDITDEKIVIKNMNKVRIFLSNNKMQDFSLLGDFEKIVINIYGCGKNDYFKNLNNIFKNIRRCKKLELSYFIPEDCDLEPLKNQIIDLSFVTHELSLDVCFNDEIGFYKNLKINDYLDTLNINFESNVTINIISGYLPKNINFFDRFDYFQTSEIARDVDIIVPRYTDGDICVINSTSEINLKLKNTKDKVFEIKNPTTWNVTYE